jgi:hypothetical protein
MTRAEERTIRAHVRNITASLVRQALDAGVYHTELEKRVERPIRIGTENAHAAAQACADELATLSHRAEAGR